MAKAKKTVRKTAKKAKVSVRKVPKAPKMAGKRGAAQGRGK